MLLLVSERTVRNDGTFEGEVTTARDMGVEESAQTVDSVVASNSWWWEYQRWM
ncbi:hypothetical protein [Neomoorella thermoacetica]|uniref:hypothetical protein n=1 Tax=Neomoorella thermoacetica TaxID=1525 RepID=UPI0004B81DF2|nr:hypothetical protein [Moorella thermoacetica]